MNKLLDKFIIIVLSVLVMAEFMSDTDLLLMIYLSLTIAAAEFYLLRRDRPDYKMQPAGYMEWVAFFIQLAIVILSLCISKFAVLLPIVFYDIVKSRNYPAAVISICSIINLLRDAILGDDFAVRHVLFIAALVILSCILSVRTEKGDISKRQYKELRDNSKEQSDRLRRQNNELLQAKDTEVYNAQLSERNRIAREIHDNVGHMLSRALLQMGALLAIHKEEPVHSELEGVRETLDTAMNNIRSSVHDLHDESIDVESSINQMTEPLREEYNVNVEIDIEDDMPRQVKYAVIGITKECISNIIKHSDNTCVDIHLNQHPSMYQLIVHDYDTGNGVAGNKHSAASELNGKTAGIGLENIRSRVEMVNGTLNITNDDGWRVFVTIPKE